MKKVFLKVRMYEEHLYCIINIFIQRIKYILWLIVNPHRIISAVLPSSEERFSLFLCFGFPAHNIAVLVDSHCYQSFFPAAADRSFF